MKFQPKGKLKPFTALAYLVSNKGAHKLLDFTSKKGFFKQLDILYHMLNHEYSFNIYTTSENLFVSDWTGYSALDIMRRGVLKYEDQL